MKEFVIRGHAKSACALRGREGVRVKAYFYCFYDVILLFSSIQGGSLKITKFEPTYFLNGPRHYTNLNMMEKEEVTNQIQILIMNMILIWKNRTILLRKVLYFLLSLLKFAIYEILEKDQIFSRTNMTFVR